MAIARVQTQKNQTIGAPVNTSITLTFGTTPTQNNVIVCAVQCASANATTVTLTQTNVTWSRITSTGTTGSFHELWYGLVGSGAGTVLTVAQTGATSTNLMAIAAEYSGTATTSIVNASNSNSSASTSSSPATASSGSATNDQQPVVWVGSLGSNGSGGTPAWSGSPTNSFTGIDSYAVSASTTMFLKLYELFTSSTGTTSVSEDFTFTSGTQTPRGAIAALRDTSASGGGSPPTIQGITSLQGITTLVF